MKEKKTCPACGKTFMGDKDATLCPPCKILKEGQEKDFEDFQIHSYTRVELANVSIWPYVPRLILISILLSTTISVVGAIGYVLGIAFLPKFVTILLVLVSLTIGSFLGFPISQKLTPSQYKPLMDRRVNSVRAWVLGGVIFGSLPALIIAAMISEQFFESKNFAFFAFTLMFTICFASLLGLTGLFIKEKSNKRSLLENFDKWYKEEHKEKT